MRLICKIKPDDNVCCGCLDMQFDGRINPRDCEECLETIGKCEIVHFGHSFLKGDWALVLTASGTIKKIPVDRLFDVKRVKE